MERRGEVEFGISEMMVLVLVIVAGLFLFSFQSQGTNFVQGIIKTFCEGIGYVFCNPPQQEEGIHTADFRSAKASFGALSCAVNAVAEGNVKGCEKQNKEEPELESYLYYRNEKLINRCKGTPAKTFCKEVCDTNSAKTGGWCKDVLAASCGTSALVLSDYYCKFHVEKAQVSCSEKGELLMGSYPLPETTPTDPGAMRGYTEKARQYCQRVFPGSDARLRSNEFRCSVKNTVCTVSNFNLPQKIGKAEEWIPYYGDPNLLVYFQNFPPEEDTWTYQTNWKIHLAIAAISILPVMKVARAGIGAGRTGLALFFGGAGTAAETAAFSSAVLGKNLVKITAARLFSVQGFKSILIRGAVLEIGAHALEIAEKLSGSVVEKLIPKANTLFLKEPYYPAVEEKVKTSVPVLLRWAPEGGDIIANAHLASPCFAENVIVDIDAVRCASYLQNADGTMLCGGGRLATPEEAKAGPFCIWFDLAKDTTGQIDDVLIKTVGFPSEAVEFVKGLMGKVTATVEMKTLKKADFNGVILKTTGNGAQSLNSGENAALPVSGKDEEGTAQCKKKDGDNGYEWTCTYTSKNAPAFAKEMVYTLMVTHRKDNGPSEYKMGIVFILTGDLSGGDSVSVWFTANEEGRTTAIELIRGDKKVTSWNELFRNPIDNPGNIRTRVAVSVGSDTETRFSSMNNCVTGAVLTQLDKNGGSVPNYCVRQYSYLRNIASQVKWPLLITGVAVAVIAWPVTVVAGSVTLPVWVTAAASISLATVTPLVVSSGGAEMTQIIAETAVGSWPDSAPVKGGK